MPAGSFEIARGHVSVHADTSAVDREVLTGVKAAVKKASSGQGIQLKAEVDGKQAEQETKNLGKKLAGLAAGAGIGAAIGKSLSDGLNIQTANSRLQGQFDITKGVAAEAGKTAGEVYRGNFGNSMEEVNGAIAAVGRNMVDLNRVSKPELKSMAEGALSIADTFSVDVNDATRAAGKLVKNGMAPDFKSAYDVLTKGFQSGLDSSGDFLDSLNEYSPYFKNLGIDGPKALAYLSEGLKAGARDTDYVADAFKELNIRVIDGSDTTAAGFAEIGLNAETMAQKFSKGGATASAALQETLKRLNSIKDPVAQNAAGVALFGTQWEDTMKQILPAMANVSGGMEGVKGSTDEMIAAIGDNPQARVESMKRRMEGWLLATSKLPGPLGEVATGTQAMGGDLVTMGGSLAMVASSSVSLAPKLGELKGRMEAGGKASNMLAAGMGKAKTAMMIGTPILAGLALAGAALKALQDRSFGTVPGLEEVKSSLIGINTVAGLENKLPGLGEDLEYLGIQVQRLADPSLGDQTAKMFTNIMTLGQVDPGKLRDARQNLGAIDQALVSLVQSGHAREAGYAFQDIATKAQAQGASIDQVKRALPLYKDALAGVANESKLAGSATEGAATSTAKLKREADAAKQALEKEKTQAEQLKTALDALNGAALSAAGAEIAYEAAIDGVTSSVKDNGRSLDTNTEKGRNNKTAVLAAVKAAQDHAEAVTDQGGTVAEGSRIFASHVVRLRETLRQSGLTKSEVDKLIATYAKTPKNVKTTLDADQTRAKAKIDYINGRLKEKGLTNPTKTKLDAEKSAWQAKYDAVVRQKKALGIPIEIAVKPKASAAGLVVRRIDSNKDGSVDEIRFGTSGRGFYRGGPVRGPGTKTSDSIPAMLSDDEHVWTADEVDGAGGHGAVEELRKMAKKGIKLPGFATGGPVSAASMRAAITSGMQAAAARPAEQMIRDQMRLALKKEDAGTAGIAGIKNWLLQQRGEPYVWGATGPNSWDCSGISSGVYGKATGKGGGNGQRYFTTASIGAGQGLRAGVGSPLKFGVTAGMGHMAGEIGGLKFEATPPRVKIGAGAAPVNSFARQFYLPTGASKVYDGGGRLGPGETGRNLSTQTEMVMTQNQIAGLIRPVYHIAELNVTIAADDIRKGADAYEYLETVFTEMRKVGSTRQVVR